MVELQGMIHIILFSESPQLPGSNFPEMGVAITAATLGILCVLLDGEDKKVLTHNKNVSKIFNSAAVKFDLNYGEMIIFA
jgi:hypothetical protein